MEKSKLVSELKQKLKELNDLIKEAENHNIKVEADRGWTVSTEDKKARLVNKMINLDISEIL